MATALEDIRARLDRGLGRVPAIVPQAAPTLESLKVRIDRAMSRSTADEPTLEGLKARIRAAKEIQGEQEPYEPEAPQEPFIHRRAPRPTMRRSGALSPIEVDTPQSLTRSAVHGVAQGAAGGVAGIPESLAIGEQSARRYLLGQFDRIDAGERPEIASAGVAMNQVIRYLNSSPDDRAGYRSELEGTVQPVEATGLYRAGQAVRDVAAETFPIPEEHETRFPVQLGRGVGSTGTFLLTGVAGKVLRLPALAVTAGTGAMVNSAATFRDAVQNGASFETAAEAAKLSAITGTSEALPIARFLDTYDKASGGQIKRILANALKGGAEEGAQELFQSVADNLVAADLYDPDREVFRGTGEAGAVGFSVGALFNTLAGMLGVKVRAGRPQDAAPESAGEQVAAAAVPDSGVQDAPVAPPETPDEPIPPEPPPTAAPAPGTITAAPPPEGPTFPRDEPGAVPPKLRQRVPRTPAALNNLLDEWDRLRNARGVSPERKAEAKRLQQDAINRLEGVKQQVQQAEHEGRVVEGQVEFRLRTASGAETTFQLEPDIEGIETLQARLKGPKAEGKFYSGAPDTAGLVVPESASPAQDIEQALPGVERAIETEHGTARIAFPDDLHARLYDLAEGKPDRAEARALHDEFEGYVLDNFTGPADVIALARDYRTEVLDQAQTAAQRRAGRPEAAGLVIDPEEQVRYFQRPTLASLRARVDRAMGRQPAAEGELPETAYTGPGAAHVGFVQDQVEGVVPAVSTKPLRREDILRPLLKDLGVPIYQGRIKSKRFLGFYRRHIEEVRIKRMGDIEVAAHELAHMLDDRFKEIRQQWLPASKANAEIREELRGVSYDKSKLFEGFAEFVRLWATQREEAKSRAPRMYGWFEDFLARNEHGPALRKAQEGMHAWFHQDAVSRARSKVGKAKEINAGLTRPFDRFRQAVADDLHGIYRMERELTGGINPVGPYETARLTHGKHALTEGALLYGAPVVKPDGSHAFEGKGLSQILDPVADRLDDFLMYAVGSSAKELRSQGREHLFTGAEIKGMVALETPEFRTAFDEYQVWNRAILDFAEDKGIINPFFRMTWKRTQYLPFHRVGQPGAFSPVPGDWKGIKALTGGTDNLRDILGNMIGNAATLIDAALTNEARLEVANLARQRGGAKFMARIPKEETITKVHRDEIERAILEALGVEKKTQLGIERQIFIDQIVQNMGPMVPLLQRGQTPYGNNVVAVLRDGKPEYYEVADPLLYSSLTHLNRPAKHWLIRLLSIPKRIGQASITLTADFLLTNVARDTLSGWVMSRHGFKPIVDSARGMVSRMTSDPNYRDFIANGGGFSSYFVEETAFKTHLERFYGSKGIDYKAVLDSPSKLLYALERFADAFEMSTRLGEYRQAIKAGEQPRHAAYSAREVSTDFAMRGDSAAIGFAYDTIIFLKAAVNGMDRLYRGVAHDPNRVTIAAKTGLIALASMGLYAINRGNPLYDDLEDWDKDTAWHSFIPKPETIQAWADGRELPPLNERYMHFRYPKIWEIGAVGSLAERSLERFLDDQPEKIGEDAWRIIRDVFRFEYLPAAVAPLYEAATNRNRFLDRPIETPTMKELQPWARSGSGTSRTLRALGEAERNLPTKFQASPAQVEALLRGYFHTWASYGLSLSDAAFFDDVPSLRVDQYPVIRRFYQRTPSRHSKYVTQLYDALEAATEARRTMRHMDRTFRPDFASELEQTPENLEFGQLSNAQKRMRSISAEMRLVVDTPDLPTLQQHASDLGRDKHFRPKIARLQRLKAWRDLGDLKRELLDLWTEERNAYAKEVVTDIEAQRRAAQ